MAAGWATGRQMGSLPSPTSTKSGGVGGGGMELIQNCDLPPPSKLYHGSDHELVVSSMNRVFAVMGRREQVGDDEGEKKLELLKAVRLSQTRAREAEKRSESLGKEKECLSNALLGQSLQLSAYRRWARLLEAHILRLEAELKDGAKSCSRCTSGVGEDDAGERMPWLVAIAFCFGAGIVLGFTTYWF